jgi:protein dithiol oxidoreductase (disulfide-forming)
MRLRTWVALAVVVALSAGMAFYAKQATPTQNVPSQTAAPAQSALPSAAKANPAQTAAAHSSREQQPEAAKTARLNEDGSETIEENTGDTGAHNPLLAAVASSAAAATTDPNPAWAEGVNYTRLVPAQPTSVGPDQVEVIEVFWYGCPHCYALDSQIESWKKHKPSYVKFSRVPVMWSDVHRGHARLFYTMENLGKLDQLHPLAFREIHVNGNMLVGNDPASTEQMQMDFLMRNGVTQQQFKQTYRSFSVETSLQRAEELTVRYRVAGVPMFVINGKYTADVASAGSPERLMTLIDYLAIQEHKH